MVMQRVELEAALGGTRPANSRAGDAGNPQTRRRSPKGGWRSSNTIPWATVKDVSALAHEVRYNAILHIMPASGTDAERKRSIALVTGHLGQELHRRDQEHVGTTIYEKKMATETAAAVDLHAHHLCRIEARDRDILAKYDGYIVDVDLINTSKDLRSWLAYCLKQRAPLPPAFEALVRQTHGRAPGAPIRGPRFTHTKAARQIQLDLEHERVLARERATASFQSPPMVAEITESKAIAPAGQLELFPHTPPTRLSEFHGGVMPNSVGQVIEFRRRQRGLTQRELGRIAGISQPTLANALAGRFPLSEWAANRIREALAA